MSEPNKVTIHNSLPNVLANEAYGQEWRRTQDVMVVNTAGGTSTHLALKSALATTLCGQKTGSLARAWFLVSGCKKCSKAALKQGIATITDTDGTLIDVATHTEVELPS